MKKTRREHDWELVNIVALAVAAVTGLAAFVTMILVKVGMLL